MDVSPDKQNIDQVFSNTTYYIDFYQRQYKWGNEPVERLLADIFYKFNIEYEKHKGNDLETSVEEYSWYYLNTYVTNVVEGKCFIVDGQQRLTTLTLVMIKLFNLTEEYKSDLRNWIQQKIAGHSGYEENFWMNHGDNTKTMRSLKNNEDKNAINISSSVTAKNMVTNYEIISSYLEKSLPEKHKLESFIFYFLKRLVLINLNVEQTDVPMVFEVINDRGVRLKSYEILKGKLLGKISKKELEHLGLNELWEKQIDKVNDHKEDEIDNFFIYYLRSRFANTSAEASNYNRDYHRTIFTQKIGNEMQLHDPVRIKKFLQEDFQYFTNLYSKIHKHSNQNGQFPHVNYNFLNDMDSQFLLILSACTLNDPQEDEKIKSISYNVDRLFSLLGLQRSYDSNDFNITTYKISAEIRNISVDKIRQVFDKYLLELLSSARGVETSEVYSYNMFKDTGNELSRRFKRYFFARIEEFIAENMKLNMKHTLYDLVANTGSVNGFHIEHILAHNEENKKLFNNDEEFFERERNRLGGLLLLKGKDNISSRNETFKEKLKTYANTLYWNETLREDTYKSKSDFSKMQEDYNLPFKPLDVFGPEELEERQQLLFSIAKNIWK